MKTISNILLLIMTIVMSISLTSCTATDSEPSISTPTAEIVASVGEKFTFTMPEELSRYAKPRLNIWHKA